MLGGLYLVEQYLPSEADARAAVSRALEAATRVSAAGQTIRFLGSAFLPEDETCFLLFEASSRAAVELVGQDSGHEYERIVRALLVGPDATAAGGELMHRSRETPDAPRAGVDLPSDESAPGQSR